MPAIVRRYRSGENYQAMARELHVGGLRLRRELIAAGVDIRRQGRQREYLLLHEDFFEEIDTEQKAYWLGFVFADGCVVCPKNGNHRRLEVGLKMSDYGHLVKLANCLGSTHPIKLRPRKTKSGRIHMLALFDLVSEKICEDLFSWGCVPRKSLDHQVPDLPGELERHFYRGLVDGDGSLFRARTGAWGFNLVGSRDAVQAFQEFLHKTIDIPTRALIREKKLFRLNYSGILQIAEIAKLLYAKTEEYLSRKYKRFLALQAELRAHPRAAVKPRTKDGRYARCL